MKRVNQRNMKSAAVTMICEENGSYNELILKAKREIVLTDYGIEDCKIRRGFTGGLVIEIHGEEAVDKADRLATKLREIMSNERVKIQRPTKRISIKIIGFDETTDREEITKEIIRICECGEDDIRVSNIRRTMRGTGIAWVVCSVETAIKLLEKGRVRIGWATVRCETANTRPLRCYKCMETGHSRYNCRSSIDRSGNCFNCGELGHTANNCANKPRCMVCKQYGKPHGHRMGGNECRPITSEDSNNFRDRRPGYNNNEEDI